MTIETEVHKHYIRIVEIISTNEYPEELEKLAAITAQCDILRTKWEELEAQRYRTYTHIRELKSSNKEEEMNAVETDWLKEWKAMMCYQMEDEGDICTDKYGTIINDHPWCKGCPYE